MGLERRGAEGAEAFHGALLDASLLGSTAQASDHRFDAPRRADLLGEPLGVGAVRVDDQMGERYQCLVAQCGVACTDQALEQLVSSGSARAGEVLALAIDIKHLVYCAIVLDCKVLGLQDLDVHRSAALRGRIAMAIA